MVQVTSAPGDRSANAYSPGRGSDTPPPLECGCRTIAVRVERAPYAWKEIGATGNQLNPGNTLTAIGSAVCRPNGRNRYRSLRLRMPSSSMARARSRPETRRSAPAYGVEVCAAWIASILRPGSYPAEVTGSIGRLRSAPGASAGTTGCAGAMGARCR